MTQATFQPKTDEEMKELILARFMAGRSISSIAKSYGYSYQHIEMIVCTMMEAQLQQQQLSSTL